MTSPAPTKTAVFPVPVSEFEIMNRFPDGFWHRMQMTLWDQWDDDEDTWVTVTLTLRTKASDETFQVQARIIDIKPNVPKTTWWFAINMLDEQLIELYGSYVTDLPLPETMGVGTLRAEPWDMQR